MTAGPLRIVVTGSECTGKTTLARLLADHFHAPWSPEYARQYAASAGRTLIAADVEPIARGQVALEDTVIAAASGLAVHDTDLVSTIVYAEHYFVEAPPWLMSTARARLADLYLLLDTDIDWEADEVRDRPFSRAELHTGFVKTLERLAAPVAAVRGLGSARFASALAAITGRLPVLAPRSTSTGSDPP
jgi:NadR type nicotinamide-nucleotide adenylyltransferase